MGKVSIRYKYCWTREGLADQDDHIGPLLDDIYN